MLGIEPLELRFAFEVNKEITCEVELSNGTCNCICFNIKTDERPLRLYSIHPNEGTVPSRGKQTVKITLLAQEMAPGHMHHSDGFIVKSFKVDFNNEPGKVVDKVNLTVVYDGHDEYNEQRVDLHKKNRKQPVDPSLDQPASSKDIMNSSGSHKEARGQGTKRLNFHPLHMNNYSSPNESQSGLLYDKASVRAVDVMTGAMGNLLPKLSHLRCFLNQHSAQTDAMEDDVECIEEELTEMLTALCNVSHEQQHQLDLQDKRRANKVRDLSYDIEDIVDDLLLHIEPMEWDNKTKHLILRAIQDIKIRVKKVTDRYVGFKQLKLGNFVANPPLTASSSVDPRLLYLYKDHKELVAIDDARDELVRKLIGVDDDASKQQLKIISIYGQGGLGKTTIAKALYDKLAAKFRLKAFVPVGRNPAVNVVLQNILLGLDRNTYTDIHTRRWNEKYLIDELRCVLKNERYLIVIDDIWDILSWEIIEAALKDNSSRCGSKIITTSRIFEVAERSGDEVCKLEPLSEDDSMKLLCARLYGRRAASDFNVGNEQSTIQHILRKCGGVPLAIITIASLLAGKPRDDWPKVYNSIGFGHEDNRHVSNTREILSFSYYDLPWHLKTCLLYLSIFPEDHVIEKKRLIWMWVAQGFVHEERGKALFKVGEGYFHELINRSMIQPVEERETYSYGKIYACRVHDMVLDMICDMAKEENFVTVLSRGDEHDQHHRRECQSNSGRILGVQKRVLEQHDLQASVLKLTVLRTFSATDGCHVSCSMMSSLLQSFKFLRVLSLENCTTLTYDGDVVMKNLSGLDHLRYLGLCGTRFVHGNNKVPMEVGDLRFLQTLDLRRTGIKSLTHGVTLLRQLKCLRIDFNIPAGMGSLTSLEELELKLVEDDVFMQFGKELGKLTELRVLRIDAIFCYSHMESILVESLRELQKLEELELVYYQVQDESHEWLDGFSPSRQLRRLVLCHDAIFIRAGPPAWMNASLIPNLSHLHMNVCSVDARGVGCLGSLPQLRSLALQVYEPITHVVSIAAGAFPRLRYCNISGGPLFTYQPGAMQCLEYLEFEIFVWELMKKDANFDFKQLYTLSYLPSLQLVSATIYSKSKYFIPCFKVQIQRGRWSG